MVDKNLDWQDYISKKFVSYKKSGNRCVEIHTYPDGMQQLYFYINSSEPMNCIPTTVENKKIADAIIENFFCGLNEVKNS